MESHASDGPSSELLTVNDLDPEFRLRVSYEVANYTVALVADPEGSPRQCGSGVLVSAGATRAILTAHHVVSYARKLQRDGNRVCAVLGPTEMAPLIDIAHLGAVPHTEFKESQEAADVGAFIIPVQIADRIAALRHRLFFRLDRYRGSASPFVADEDLWVAQGFPASQTTVVHEGQNIQTTRLYNFSGLGSSPGESRDAGDHDLLDIAVDYGHNAGPPPRDWGGMSGGGLWQLRLRRPKGTPALEYERPILRGVLVYQGAAPDGQGSVTAEGPRSVYEVAYKLIVGDVSRL
jgi:hypothetical protein